MPGIAEGDGALLSGVSMSGGANSASRFQSRRSDSIRHYVGRSVHNHFAFSSSRPYLRLFLSVGPLVGRSIAERFLLHQNDEK